MENKSINTTNLAVTYGIILAIGYILITTGINLFYADTFILYYALKAVAYILLFIVIGLVAVSIRKKAGGYLTFKQMFRNVFIMILIINILYYIYIYIYMLYIDTEMLERVKNGTLAFMENRNVPEEQLQQTAEKFDAQLEEAKNFHIGKNLVNFFSLLIMDSLFGLIVSAIAKKNPPEYQQL